MWLNLSCVGVPLNTHLLYKLLRDSDPVLIRECNLVSIQVTSRSVKLALGDDPLQVPDLQLESVGVIRNLFAHC